jgi:PLP dependent protein
LAVNKEQYLALKKECDEHQVTLVAVSKTKPVEDILELYALGHRDFGENYVQELLAKHEQLPADIRWHFIGHLQSNKVKQVISFVSMIHGIDSEKLLREVSKQAIKAEREVDVLLQVHIAQEETKFGLDDEELKAILSLPAYANVRIRGLMGMASFTTDTTVVGAEFEKLKTLFDNGKLMAGGFAMDTLSMGMSSDYELAIEKGSNLIRVGSLIFGSRI